MRSYSSFWPLLACVVTGGVVLCGWAWPAKMGSVTILSHEEQAACLGGSSCLTSQTTGCSGTDPLGRSDCHAFKKVCSSSGGYCVRGNYPNVQICVGDPKNRDDCVQSASGQCGSEVVVPIPPGPGGCSTAGTCNGTGSACGADNTSTTLSGC